MPKTRSKVLPVFFGVLVICSLACSKLSPPPTKSKAADTAQPAPTPTSIPTPVPTSVATPNYCVSGECAPTGDLPGWQQLFVDEFAGTVKLGEWSDCNQVPFTCSGLPEPYRSKWWAFTEGWTDQANGIYSSPQVLAVANGVLDIYLHTAEGVHRVAAPVPLIHGPEGSLGQLYGRYAIRFRADTIPGYKIAWLLWPDSETWPRDGEIDFPEGNLDDDICAFVHHQDATAGNDQDAFFAGVGVSGGWHTAVTEWTQDAVQFMLDDEVLGKSTTRIPDTPMHWVLEATTNLDGYEPDDVVTGHIQIDWVAVYAAR
jgi:hypothetical protein